MISFIFVLKKFSRVFKIRKQSKSVKKKTKTKKTVKLACLIKTLSLRPGTVPSDKQCFAALQLLIVTVRGKPKEAEKCTLLLQPFRVCAILSVCVYRYTHVHTCM